MPAADIVWDTDEGRFNYRVAGVCVARGRVLLTQVVGDDFWFMPGGRCQLMESATGTLAREMQEELGVPVRIGRLLWINEEFFVLGGQSWHEVGLYFRMALPADCDYRDQDRIFIPPTPEGEPLFAFRWFPLGELDRIRLFPVFLRTALQRPPRTPRHVVGQEAETSDQVPQPTG
jgi:8-oxo-dGTP pyrophosphatase MutT (NUDIX family)